MDSVPPLSLSLFVRVFMISATASALNLEGELFKDLMKGYNKNIRPMENSGDITQVDIKMTLTNLISLSEKEEALTTSVWIEMQWCDYRLRWDQPPRSALYGNITSELRMPSKSIWLPEVILENNSQTYSANEIKLVLKEEDNHTLEWVDIDPEAFTENGEWAIKHRPAKTLINAQHTKDDSHHQAGGQKCTMSIATLLGQTVFLFLIAKKVPETSRAVPLIGKYLMFAMSVTTTVVMNCVVVLNVSLRTPNTHKMTDNVRKIFLNILPRLLKMQMKPWKPNSDNASEPGNGENHVTDRNNVFLVPCRRRSSMSLISKAEEYVLKTARSELMFTRLKDRNGLMKSVLERIHDGLEGGSAEQLSASLAKASPQLKQCVASCKHIAETASKQNNFQSENEEWFLVARVIDRVCFIVMVLVFFIGTIGIFLMGHFNQPPSSPFPGDPKRYLPLINNLTDLTESAMGANFLG
ncbi:Acetylcholine receptor subunit gamma [Dissostichus eleginoides]|uniref:Acetylcholine receptor subunit gamma n=1 Tax=Dissostichus eleginoides TaxID=100907 RepID=A0AAD9BAU2_DISEL|nr:Acetylcholine receptor subunit gamma [Dissostichus eleginoides]